jgi:hypothetical protein
MSTTTPLFVDPERVFRCKACRAQIVFLLTAGRRRMPVNLETVEPGDIAYEPGRHVNHWSTCSAPKSFRRK